MARRIPKDSPPFLFRYRPPAEVTCGYLEGLLRENHIYASPPRGFSDWYDCRALIDFERPRKEWLRYWNQIFKTLSLRGKARPQAVREAMETGTWKNPSKHAEISKGIQETLDNSGVICLTDTALDQRMWDEYAGGYRGICLCFETSEFPFLATRDVNYVPELSMVGFNAEIEEKVEAFLLTKRSSYSWEREWRYVDYRNGGGYKQISPWALRAIVLGSQAEEKVRQEVMHLVSRWKPDVVLWVLDATEGAGPGLRLQLLEDPQVSTMTPIIPPIQERSRSEVVRRSKASRLLDALGWVPTEHRKHDLDSQIERLATRLKAVESSHGRRSEEAAADAGAAAREATDLLRELVDRSGSAVPGYGEVTVLLYELVHAVVIKSGLRL
jgi:hypothetical protein